MCAHARPWPPFQLVQVAVPFLKFLLDSTIPTQVHACAGLRLRYSAATSALQGQGM